MTHEKSCPQCGAKYSANDRFCTLDGATLVSHSPRGDLVGTVIADRYLVTAKLGDGGMGQVYLAEHVRMKRKCAVKVMRHGLMGDPDAISRFNREAENASQVIHQNVAAIYDFGEAADGLIYLAMEFVDGESLARIIEREKAIHPIRVAEIVRQAAEALDVAHAHGILHRDLKPENIMIARTRDHLDMVKIVDFGIARAMSSDAQRVTRTGSLVGTPEFMSPEQFAGDVLDARSDLYSLALVAFNMLTGASAYPSGTSKDNLIVRLTQPPRRLHEVKDLPWPESLQTTFDKALASDPASRHASVLEFSREITASIAAMPASQTGEIYLSALATALEARAAATPARSLTPVPASAAAVTGDAVALPPTPAALPRHRRRAFQLLTAASVVGLVALVWGVTQGGGGATSEFRGGITPSDSAAAAAAAALAESLATPGVAATPGEEVFARTRGGVAWVTGRSGSGMAFVVSSSGVLLTPTHLVRGDTVVSVLIDDTTRVRARVVLSDSGRAVAVLAIAPSRCQKCAVLPLAADSAAVLAVGTPVLALGATRVARPRMIEGNVKSADLRKISTSATTNSAESGAPVVGLSGEVVAMSVFPPAGRATEIHITELRAALSEGTRLMAAAGFVKPTDLLLPVRPRTPFPAAPITALAAVENLDLLRRYRATRGDFEVLVMTPPVMGWRDARAKAAHEKLRAAAPGGKLPSARVDPVQGWPGWDACVRDRCAVVAINVVPDRTPFLFHKPAEIVSFSRGDVAGITLLRDGVAIEPIETAFFPAVLNSSAHVAAKRAVFSQGVALYRAREFAPSPTGAISKYAVVVTDATRRDRPERIELDGAIIQAIINDFAQYGLQR